jgi:acetyl-CoA carboxylase biotin carboxyl carrier protein
MDLTDEDVKAILKLLETLPFGDLELETPEFRLTLRRTADGEWTRESATLRSPRVLQSATPRRFDLAKEAKESGIDAKEIPPAEAERTARGTVDVRTPLPGIFYRSPKPGAPPFVEVGTQVGANTVVAIVETMKLMNSLYAGVEGRVAEICLADASFAEQDAVVIRIEADRP